LLHSLILKLKNNLEVAIEMNKLRTK
jgi:hypothetical protein